MNKEDIKKVTPEEENTKKELTEKELEEVVGGRGAHAGRRFK